MEVLARRQGWRGLALTVLEWYRSSVCICMRTSALTCRDTTHIVIRNVGLKSGQYSPIERFDCTIVYG